MNPDRSCVVPMLMLSGLSVCVCKHRLTGVVGKLAAVWPLVGIVIEAIVLCVIIVVHERRKARQRALSDTDADNDKDVGGAGATTNRLQVITLLLSIRAFNRNDFH